MTVCGLVPCNEPCAPATKVTVCVSIAKLAVMVMSAVTLVTVSGLSLPTWSPVQPVKWWPRSGTAVTAVQSLPWSTVWPGVPLSVPCAPATNVTVWTASVANVRSSPYPAPAVFVAYARTW